MRTENIYANTIDDAAEQILGALKKSVRSRDNVFYLDGWDGLGASAVLQAVARRVATTSSSPAGLEFEKVIHIDCLKWESRRALQRAVAEQLDLPAEVMEMFDREDEENDFRGVAQGSRTELQVDREMYQHIQNRRFLVIFQNGSNEEIDLASLCGFPLSGYSTVKVLWTFQGRFRLKPRAKVDAAMKTAGTTDVFLLVYPYNKTQEEIWPYLVQEEAVEVVAACKVNTGGSRGIIDQPAQVVECFLYMWELCCRGGQLIDYDLDTHGTNYWVCDGIVLPQQLHQGQRDDGLWRAAAALQFEMPLDVDYHQFLLSPHLATFVKSKPYWSSPTSGFTRIPDGAISNGGMLKHYADKLGVLKLSGCTFDFQAPPFLCCHSLRFLWLEHCQSARASTDGAGDEEDIRRCFQRLWVLDMRYTDCDHILSAQMLDLMTQLRELNVTGVKEWDMGQLQGRLPNIRKLRVKSSSVRCSSSCSEDLFSEMNKMELLDFSSYTSTSSPMKSLLWPGVSGKVTCLETVVINQGCVLEQISFNGCNKVKNLLLQGWMWVRTIDLSGTAVKTLDLSKTAIPYLDELYLLDCKKLCAIVWPSKDKMKNEGLGKLCIDTTPSAPAAQSREEKAMMGTSTTASRTSVVDAAAPHGSRLSSEVDWNISVRDARLLVSLEPVYSDSRKAYVEVSSPFPAVDGDGSRDEGIKSRSSGQQQVQVNMQQQTPPAVYTDITVDHHQQASGGDGDGDAMGIMWMYPCPVVPELPKKSCYIHIQDQPRTKLPQGVEATRTINVPQFVTNCKILHVHDSMSITSTPSHNYGSEWPSIEWCRIERCPKLDFVFYNDQGGTTLVYQLRTFWASQLLKSRYISTSNGWRAFPHLTLLHVDFCPRLIHVHRLSWWWEPDLKDSFCLLETLEIAWCADLREIFPLTGTDKTITKDFPKLKHIHLHELPSLHRICEVSMSTPNLETIKVRGCWSLTRLPNISGCNKVVECDCERDWWNRLEWDDASQANHYKPIHPRYYKKTMLRGSVLR